MTTYLHSFFHEMRLRSYYVLFSTFSTFFISYSFHLEILYIIGKPFLEFQHRFVFLELTEAFYTLLRISTSLTFLLIFPLLVYHFWSFFVPSLYQLEREKTSRVCVLLLSLFLCEILFTYFFFLPKICDFLLSFEMASGTETSGFHGIPLLSVEFTARLQSYVHVILKILWGVFVFFQIPLCVILCYSQKLLHVSSFYRNRKLLGLFALLVSAFLVPPDFLSQLVVAFFFFMLLEFLIFIGFFFE